VADCLWFTSLKHDATAERRATRIKSLKWNCLVAGFCLSNPRKFQASFHTDLSVTKSKTHDIIHVLLIKFPLVRIPL
jgi:hypothetical protein